MKNKVRVINLINAIKLNFDYIDYVYKTPSLRDAARMRIAILQRKLSELTK